MIMTHTRGKVGSVGSRARIETDRDVNEASWA